MRYACVAAALLVSGAEPGGAQHATGFAAADSAAVARAASARAVAARRAGDLRRARDEAARASAAWPVQPAYALSWAAAGARAGDTASVLAGLARYAGLGLGRDVLADSIFLPFLRVPDAGPLVAALRRELVPVINSRIRASLIDSTFWPEGLDHDPRTGRYYVTSVRHGAVTELARDGTQRQIWPRGAAERGAVLAARVDTAHDALWLTLSGIAQRKGFVPGDSSIGALVRVRLTDGALERRWELPATPGGHVLGDLMLAPSGDVLVTDSNEPVLYRLRPGADSLEPVRHPLFRSLQGMTMGADARTLYVADHSIGLLRVDLVTADVARLDDAPHRTSVGCDGITFDRGSLIAVQNGLSPARLMRFVLDETGRRIVRAELLDRNTEVADEPTSVIVVGRDAVYVANSQWEKHDAKGHRASGTALRPPILLAVPLGERARPE